MEGHAKSGPISRLPVITFSDAKNQLRDVPVCQVSICHYILFFFDVELCCVPLITASLYQPFHLELNFFNKENRVVQYPAKAFYLDGFNLMAYNIASGGDNLYKKLYSMVQLSGLFSSFLL